MGISFSSWTSRDQDQDFLNVQELEEFLKEGDVYERLALVYKLSGQLINEATEELQYFVAYFEIPGLWNLKSSQRMLLRAAHTFAQNKATIKQIVKWMDTYLKDNTESFY